MEFMENTYCISFKETDDSNFLFSKTVKLPFPPSTTNFTHVPSIGAANGGDTLTYPIAFFIMTLQVGNSSP